jgi:hypothetical protein
LLPPALGLRSFLDARIAPGIPMKIAARASRAARMTGVLQMGWFATAGGMRSFGVGR